MTEWIDRNALTQPNQIAIREGPVQLTYGYLRHCADILARNLRTAGLQPGQAVGLYMYHSPWLIVGELGIHRAGGYFVPLNPTLPKDRLDCILEVFLSPESSDPSPAVQSCANTHFVRTSDFELYAGIWTDVEGR